MRSLLAGLPRDSLVAAVENPGLAEASMTNELLAALIEVVDGVSWRAVMPHAKRGWQPPRPMQVPRPWAPPKTKRKATSVDLARMFAGRVRGGG